MKSKKKEPGKTLVFRVTPEGMPRIWKTIELTEKQTLHHLHLALSKAYALKGDHIYAFYLSGKHWDGGTEYGGPSAGSPNKANKATLGSLTLEKNKPFLYIFNMMAAQWFTIEWTGTEKAQPKTTYPQLLEEEGELPPQPPSLISSLPEPLKKLVKALKPAIDKWLLNPTKMRTNKEIQETLTLLNGIYKILDKRGEEAWHLLEEASGLLLVDWLLSIPMSLAKKNQAAEAIKLCDRFAPFADEIYFSCEKAMVLAQIGKREKSLEKVREHLTHFPSDPYVVAKAAEVFLLLNEVGHAERLFRKALDLTAENLNEREWILEKLLTLLEENERIDEAIEIVQTELDRG